MSFAFVAGRNQYIMLCPLLYKYERNTFIFSNKMVVRAQTESDKSLEC